MGFFQELKEDLSLAVNELLPEDELTEEGVADAAAGDEVLSNEAEQIIAEEAPEEESTPVPVEDNTLNEEMFRAAVERIDENADAFATEKSYAQSFVEELEAEQTAPVEETLAEPQPAAQPVSEPAQPDAFVREVYEEVTNTEPAESALEKEVSEVMEEKADSVMGMDVLDETAIVTKGMKVKGSISSQGALDVLGSIKGNVEILGKLNVSGSIEGNSNAAEVFADAANVTGDIHATGTVKIGLNSVIIGNIFATSAVIAGAVKGDIDVQGPVVLDSTAIIMGNIKSKSVQMNNGAVIEGMCSQCYADVSPSSFFKDIK